MNNKKNLLLSFIMAIMILATIAVATATDITFTEFSNDPDLSMRIDEDTVVTIYEDQVIYYDSDGVDKSINISPYHEDNISYMVNLAQEKFDLYFICDHQGGILCKIDYSGSSLSTVNISSTLNLTTNNYEVTGVFPERYYVTYSTSIFNTNNKELYTVNDTVKGNWVLGQLCYEDSNSRCAAPLYEDTTDGYYFYNNENGYSTSPSFANLVVTKFFYNTTSQTLNKLGHHFIQSGTAWYSTSNTLYRCTITDIEEVYCIGNQAGSGILLDFYNRTTSPTPSTDQYTIPYPTSPYNSEVVSIQWFDDNNAGQTVVVNDSSDRTPLYFTGTTLLNPENDITVYDETKTFSLTDGFLTKINSTHYLLTNDYNATTNYTNSPPNLASYTISDTNPDLFQEVYIDIFESGAEEEDIIRYGVKCEGTGNYSENTNGQFTCTYNTTGLYNLTMAVTDNFHVGSWYDETNVTINVTNTTFTSGTLIIDVIDGEQLAVQGATVVVNNEIKTTNAYGRVSFTTPSVIYYDAIISKNGYTTRTYNYLANGEIQIAQIISLSGETNLIVTVLGENGTGLQDAIVSYTNVYTYDYNYDFTDANGQAIFSNIASGSLIIQASATDYDSNSKSVNIEDGLTNYVNIQLELLNPAFTGTATNRSCVDNGIWLCGNTAIVEHSCTTDSDCELSDYCIKGLNTCSRFNYSACDAIGMPRTQQCVMKLSAENTLTNTTNWVLGNLLWVIVMLLFFVGLGLLFVAWKK